MKKTLALLLAVIFVLVFTASCGLSSNKSRGTNVKIYSEDIATVYFYPVCPKCGHVSSMCKVNLSENESHETLHQCETCWELYDINIQR